ncbi:MAG: 4Fe-4S cluster-binding domain-containing protein [Methanosarcinaceae archaeon]|nr:4Fe-4S cluster-binding domain-containing protein [Methanosarcinaceae archaeon]
MDIIINSIDYTGSIVDGPGIRTVLFIQGCNKKCDGCHNPNTWDIKNGRKIHIENLIRELRNNVINKKLTISGGEPLLQYPAVLELVKCLNDFNIALYTGFELEEVPTELFTYLNYIKVGKYVKERRCTTIPYIGSTNQSFINLNEEKQ